MVGASINLLGSILFGISAVAGHIVPSTGSMLDQAASNWNTALGAACFLACALFTLFTGLTWKSPRLRRLRKFEQVIVGDAEKLVSRSRQTASG